MPNTTDLVRDGGQQTVTDCQTRSSRPCKCRLLPQTLTTKIKRAIQHVLFIFVQIKRSCRKKMLYNTD